MPPRTTIGWPASTAVVTEFAYADVLQSTAPLNADEPGFARWMSVKPSSLRNSSTSQDAGSHGAYPGGSLRLLISGGGSGVGLGATVGAGAAAGAHAARSGAPTAAPLSATAPCNNRRRLRVPRSSKRPRMLRRTRRDYKSDQRDPHDLSR